MACLINRYRARYGLAPLRQNVLLTRAAQAYSAQMASRRFFSHVSPRGSTTLDRLRAVGYIPRFGRWVVGENLGWAEPGHAAPRFVFGAWTRTSVHRVNLLHPGYRELGVGVARPTPFGAPGVTYVVDFGARRR
jgi:uncharacterized protein YkwD